MSDIAERLNSIKSTLPEGVELVAVSKFHPVAALREAYDVGQRVFGESRVQELVDKIPEMPDDTRWHFIGHLQTNKLKYLIGNVSLIESVDSLRLLEMIDDLSFRKGVITRVLMQLHVAAEETKFGFTPAELIDWFATRGFESLKATHICGLMGMEVKRSVVFLVKVHAPADQLSDLLRCTFDNFFDGVAVAEPVAGDHGVVDMFVEIVYRKVCHRCHTALSESRVCFVESGFTY